MAPFGVTYLLVFAPFLISQQSSVKGQTVFLLDPVKSGEEAGLIVVPGAELRGETYWNLAARIQQRSPLRLHVALTTDYRDDTPNPVQVGNAVELSIETLRSANLPDHAPIYVAGHSLGGTFLQTWVNKNPTLVAGMMLWGSYLTGATENLAAFPTPVMHLSGDLDGQVRITRNAKTFRELQHIMLTTGPSELIATKPVVLVEGVNHFQFSSGEKPPLVEKEDLPADVTADEAYDLLAEPIDSFMKYNMGFESSTSYENLNSHYAATAAKIAPLTVVKDLEWNGVSSQWLITAQEMVAGFENGQAPVGIVNVGYEDKTEFDNSKPSVQADLIQTTAMVTFPRNMADLSGIKESANEIAGKMKSQDAIDGVIPKVVYAQPADCNEINQAAFEYALNIAPEVVRNRYNTRGYAMEFAGDTPFSSLQDWETYGALEFTTLLDGKLEVKSGSFSTGNDDPTDPLAGVQYCTLMSPHRAMEWIYVDSLRLIY
nr:uncharacterized protein LOC129258240 [Lytechinus pictus]